MSNLSPPELITMLGAFLGSALTILKVALNHHRSMSERFVGYLESALLRQEQASARFESALERLADGVGDQGRVLRQLSERLLGSERRIG